jgi:hypothetical protein
MLAPVIEGLRGQPALGQEDFSAAQARRADGAGASSAACAGPPGATEVVGLLRRWLDEQPDWGRCQPCSGCEAQVQGRRSSIASQSVSSCTHHKAKRTCWVRTSSQMRRRLTGTGRQNAIPFQAD